MPRKGRKHWIDPKKSTKFQLVFRSQADPDFTEGSNDRILAPVDASKIKDPQNKAEHYDLIEQFAKAQKPQKDPKEARFADVDDEEEYSEEDADWDIAGELNGEQVKHKGKGKEKGDSKFDDADEEEDNPNAKFADADEEEEEKVKKPKRKGKAKEDVNLQDFEVGEYGFPLDGYNYAQHFKSMGGQGAVFVEAPSVKDAVAYKKPVILKDDVFKLEKGNDSMRAELFGAAPVSDLRDIQLDEEGDIDPEILAALNNPDEFEQFDDTFVKAMKTEASGDDFWGEGDEGDEGSDYYDSDEEGMERPRHREITDLDSRPERSEEAKIFDERFEKLAEGYDEEEIGELDPDDPGLQGTLSLDQLTEAMDEFLNVSKGEFYKPTQSDLHREKVLQVLEVAAKQPQIEEVEEEPEKDPWDCESIISTYSNLENHPTLITDDDLGPKKIKLSKKTGIPLGVLPNQPAPAPKKSNPVDLGKARSKAESKEERKARKAQVKEARRAARQQKKVVKEVFKSEEQRQITQKIQQGPTAGKSIIKY